MSIDITKLEGVDSCELIEIKDDFKPIIDIERSIIKKYRKQLWTPFIKGVKEFEMVDDGDKIAVCISGGKDSLLLAKLMQEMQRHTNTDFELEFIAMNPGFNDINYEMLTNTCKKIGIDVKVFDSNIFEVVEKIAKDYPCYMCARMRRGALYDFAKQLGCNKIALGHHYDDYIETVMINVLYGGKFQAMMPKLKATGVGNEGMELIRPLTYVRESDIIKYTKDNGIQAMNCGCVVAAGKTSSKRAEVKELLRQLRAITPDIDKSIFASTKNANITSLLGYQKDGEEFSFLDFYEENNE